MGLFDMFAKADIGKGVEECKNTPGAVLLDVRTPEEYRGGHIPGSKNVPLQNIAQVRSLVKDTSTPLFVYCYSGARSGEAVAAMKRMGYTNLKNIGGIANYSGPLE